MSEKQNDHSKRDSETLFLLGIFIVVLAVPVLIGTAFADTGRAMVVNAVAGVVLLITGVGFILRARSIS